MEPNFTNFPLYFYNTIRSLFPISLLQPLNPISADGTVSSLIHNNSQVQMCLSQLYKALSDCQYLNFKMEI